MAAGNRTARLTRKTRQAAVAAREVSEWFSYCCGKQIEEQARQKVLSAEAEAKSMQIRAQALEQNAKLVQWEAVQKWNGVLPQYMLGGGATPFINLTPSKD